jgi:hypothetical protein
MPSFMPDPSKFPTLSQFMDKLLKPMSNGYYDLGQGLWGSFIKTPKGNILYVWQPNSGSAYIYKWDTTSNTWKLAFSITNLVKGAEEPRSIYGLRYITWQDTSVSTTTVTDNGLTLKLTGPSVIEVDQQASYTVYAVGGTLPYSYKWSSDGLQASNGNTASYKWTTAGTKVVSVSVNDSNGNTATIQMNVSVTEQANAELIGSNIVYAYTPQDPGTVLNPFVMRDYLDSYYYSSRPIMDIYEDDIYGITLSIAYKPFNPYDLDSVKNAYPDALIMKLTAPGQYKLWESGRFFIPNSSSTSDTLTVPSDVSSTRPYYVPLDLDLNSDNVYRVGTLYTGPTEVNIDYQKDNGPLKRLKKSVIASYAQPIIFQMSVEVQYYIEEHISQISYLTVTYDKDGKLVYTWANGANDNYVTNDLFWQGYKNGEPIKSSVDNFVYKAVTTSNAYPVYDASQMQRILNLHRPITLDWKTLGDQQAAVATVPIVDSWGHILYYKPVSQTSIQINDKGLQKGRWLIRSLDPYFRNGIIWIPDEYFVAVRFDSDNIKLSGPFSVTGGEYRELKLWWFGALARYYLFNGGTVNVTTKPFVNISGSFGFDNDFGSYYFIIPNQNLFSNSTVDTVSSIVLPKVYDTAQKQVLQLPDWDDTLNAYFPPYNGPVIDAGAYSFDTNPIASTIISPSSVVFNDSKPITVVGQYSLKDGTYNTFTGVESGIVSDSTNTSKNIALYHREGSYITIYPLQKGTGTLYLDYTKIGGVEPKDSVSIPITVNVDIGDFNVKVNDKDYTKLGSKWSQLPPKFTNHIFWFQDLSGFWVSYLESFNEYGKVQGAQYYYFPNIPVEKVTPSTTLNVSIVTTGNVKVRFRVWSDDGGIQSTVYSSTDLTSTINNWLKTVMVADGQKYKNDPIHNSFTSYRSLNYAIDFSPDGGSTWVNIKSGQEVISIENK